MCKTLAALVTHSPEAPSWLSLASIGWGATKRAEASCETRGQSTFTVLAAKSRERKQATRVRLGVDASVIRSCFVYRLHDASSAVVFGRTRGRHLSSVASEDIHVNVDVLATPNEHAVRLPPMRARLTCALASLTSAREAFLTRFLLIACIRVFACARRHGVR